MNIGFWSCIILVIPFLIIGVLFAIFKEKAAKFVSGTFNYVLAVYFFNLVAVSVNLIVYFINTGYDRQQSLQISK